MTSGVERERLEGRRGPNPGCSSQMEEGAGNGQMPRKPRFPRPHHQPLLHVRGVLGRGALSLLLGSYGVRSD